MKYAPTDVARVPFVDIEPRRDYRSFFSCWYYADDFVERGVKSTVGQANISFNCSQDTSWGLRRRMSSYTEGQLVHCTRRAVGVDVLPESSTCRRHTPGAANWSGARQ
jgi:dTDP-4-dehydrorhamnose 3,5-epimerase